MRLVAGNMIWSSIDKIPNKYTYLSEDIECDVLIIGGGLTGSLAGYYFTKEGVNTVLVEKNIIGYGSTRASTSIIQYEIDTDLHGLKYMIGEKNAVDCFKLCEKTVYEIEKIVNTLDEDCDFSLKECLYYANKSSKLSPLKKEFDIRKKYGFNVEYLDKESCKDKFSFPIEGGIYSRAGGAQINPYRFTHNLISKSIKNGLQVYENTEVIKISSDNSNVIIKTKNHFNIKCKKVIIATGYEAKKLINHKIVDMYRTFTIVTKSVKNFDGWFNKCIIRDNDDPYIYLRTTGDNRIIIGGEDEKVGADSSKMSNLCDDENKVSEKKYNILLEKLKTFFPNIEDIEVEYKFNGLFGVSKDGLPYIGEYKNLPNCYFSLGYGSNGIIYAVMGAQLLKDLYLGDIKPELKLFRFDR